LQNWRLKVKKINLVVVAHPDDEILGFGGSGMILVEKGELVQPIILCGNVDARTNRPTDVELYDDMMAANSLLGFSEPILGSFPNIRMNTVDHLDIVKFIESQLMRFQPSRIFTHHPSDLNDDHGQVSQACQVATRYFQRTSHLSGFESLHFMEILSSSDWVFPGVAMAFEPNLFIDIESAIDKKISALSKYRNVMRSKPHPRSEHVLRGHAAYRGGQCSANYAEAFQTVYRRGF
jgi:N-acetylglucosamine malate deacetylase 1